MAVDADVGAEDIELAVEAPRGSPLKLVLFIVGALVLAGGGTAGALFATGIIGGDKTDAAAAKAEAAVQKGKEAIYVSLDPPFTVNFRDKSGARYLQVSLEVMTRESDVEPLVKKHMPVIRNDLMMLFSSKTSKELATREGKEKLRAETLAAIQKILEREAGKPGVEAVYFTNFVMQ